MEKLTASQFGVTTAPNRTFGPTPVRIDYTSPEPTGDVTLDRIRSAAALANHFGEHRVGADLHELADGIAAGLPGYRERGEAKVAIWGGLDAEPSDEMKERMRAEHGPARSREAV